MDFSVDWVNNARGFSEKNKRPLVTMSYAQSLDGSITAQRGQALQISGSESSIMTHMIRAAHNAILIGIGTLRSDNPCLTVRLVEGSSPQPVILDSKLRTPLECRLMQEHPLNPWLAATEAASNKDRDLLEAAGAEVIIQPGDSSGRVDLFSLLERLWRRGIHSLMVEGGARVISSFLSLKLVDYLVLTIAPYFVGGLNIFAGSAGECNQLPCGLPSLEGPNLDLIGEDIIVRGKVKNP
jgi:riboflavin-specific deaminase-like protein